jgi:hypothetical protein
MALAPAAVIALASCGGSSSPTLTQTQFTSQVNAICTKGSESSAAVPQPNVSSSIISPAAADLPAIAAYLSKEVAVLQHTADQLKAMGTPPAKQSQWTQSLAAIQHSVDDAKAAQSAAKSGNVTTYDQALGRVVEDGSTIDQAFGGFGAMACTSTPSGSPSPSRSP